MTTEKTLDVESFEDIQERKQYEKKIARATSKLLERDENEIWFYHKYGNQWRSNWLK